MSQELSDLMLPDLISGTIKSIYRLGKQRENDVPKVEKQLDGSWSSGYPKENHDSYQKTGGRQIEF